MAPRNSSSTSASKSKAKAAEDTTDTTTKTIEVGNAEASAEPSAEPSADGGAAEPGAPEATTDDGASAPPTSAETASQEQLDAAPNSTAARNVSGDAVNDTDQGTDLSTIDTGDRHPMHPTEQAQTGAPNGADGEVTVRGEASGGATAEQVKAARAFQHADLPGHGPYVVFNSSSTPIVVDRDGHMVDAKARRRLPELDAVAQAAIRSGDLIDESDDNASSDTSSDTSSDSTGKGSGEDAS